MLMGGSIGGPAEPLPRLGDGWPDMWKPFMVLMMPSRGIVPARLGRAGGTAPFPELPGGARDEPFGTNAPDVRLRLGELPADRLVGVAPPIPVAPEFRRLPLCPVPVMPAMPDDTGGIGA